MQRNTDENLIIRQPQLELSDEDLRGQPGQSHAPVWPPQHKPTQEETIQPPAKKEKKNNSFLHSLSTILLSFHLFDISCIRVNNGYLSSRLPSYVQCSH